LATAEQINLIVKAEVDKALKDLNKFNKGMATTQKTGDKTGETFDKMKSSFLKTAAAITAIGFAFKKTVDAASALEEATGKFNVVFGDTPELMQFATESVNELTESYQMSEREAKQYLGSIQDLLVPMGVMPDRAAAMSDRLVKLAADLGSFNDKATPDVMMDLTAALTGSFETMKKYGVVLNETTIKEEARRQGLWDGKGVLDAVTKSQVAYDLILRDTAAAHGDVARTADSYANTMKRLNSRFEDITAEIGKELLPALAYLATAFMQGASDGNFLIKSFKFIARAAAQLATGLGLVVDLINQMNAASKQEKFSEHVDDYRVALDKTAPSLKGLKQGTQEWRNELKRIKKEAPATANKIAQIMKWQSGAQEDVAKQAGVRAAISRRAEKQIQALNGQTAETVDTKTRKIIKNTGATKDNTKTSVEGAKKRAEGMKKAVDAAIKEMARQESEQKKFMKEQVSVVSSSLGEISSLYAQHTQNRITNLSNETSAQMQALEEQYNQRLEAEGLREETDLEKSETRIQELQTDLANAESEEDRARIRKEIKDAKNAKKRAAIQAEYAAKKKAIEEKSAAEELKLKRDAARMQKKLSIAQVLLETPLAAMRAYSSAQVLGPVAGPIVGGINAGLATALGAAKLALIQSTPLPEAAEGGIIPGSSAGTILRAGEGGRSEAIIPFENEDAMSRIGGPQITVNLNIENAFTDEDFPEQVAVRIDQALSKLVQDRNSRLQDSL